MNEDANKMNCAEFQAHLPELIATGEDISSHSHLQTCELCRELLSDLETIAEAARQLFPIADPPDDLWDHIKAAIESDTVPELPIVAADSQAPAKASAATAVPGLSTEPA